MARRQDVQSADGVISSLSPFGILHCVRSTAPVNLKPGFARGCLYQYLNGAAGSSLFVNVGDHTATGSAWVSLDALGANFNPTARVVTSEVTVGNTTLTAAAVVGGIINRGGTQVGGFTDTFPTGTAIQTAIGSFAYAGMSWELVYRNTTGQTATLAGGTGSTLSNITSVATNTTARFLVTLTGTNTVTIAGLSSGAST